MVSWLFLQTRFISIKCVYFLYSNFPITWWTESWIGPSLYTSYNCMIQFLIYLLSPFYSSARDNIFVSMDNMRSVSAKWRYSWWEKKRKKLREYLEGGYVMCGTHRLVITEFCFICIFFICFVCLLLLFGFCWTSLILYHYCINYFTWETICSNAYTACNDFTECMSHIHNMLYCTLSLAALMPGKLLGYFNNLGSLASKI